ncbi:MarR family transcriptional regulator [Actinomadura rubrobrunea]|uniref:MarR family transcriptional regulator n=1 Tax=Actinomadura rubrobrunea TaxID=115335 RepID=A0A9W6UXT7_9ACTN|nr:MarR family transcriptional regulator [Actinomadura rubrobrunea]GLW67699.1 MarR family transcriptional regulator [Actinomadura rubrobrunea]
MTATADAEIPIEDYLCLALWKASRSVTSLYRDLLDELKLTYPQYLVMRLLWQKGPQPVKEIASVLQLDYGTLSPLLKRLEAAGLVTRSRRRDDERSVEIGLTDAGRALRAKADDVPTRLTCAMGLDTQTSAQLLQMLTRLTETICASPEPGDRKEPLAKK